jgi:leader peptidase (prepilin peptidase)/N-methyltransferase
MTIGVVTATTAAVTLGPLTLVLARRRMHTMWRPGPTETTALTAAIGVVAAFVVHGSRPVAVLLPLVLLGPAAAVVDAYEGRLPDLLTGPLLGATLLIAAASGSDGARGIAVAAVVTVLAALATVMVTDALGWGDVKLVPTLAIVLGHQGALLAGLVAVVLLVGVTAAVVSVRDRHAIVPYGPALVFGTIGAAGL